mgnify:CR=1 FL=1|jgi:small subunit ribosomal protein S5
MSNTETAQEYYEKLVSVNRVTKVVKGGRNFGFSVIIIAGDQKGMVGYGVGKAKDISEAKIKASKLAKKNMIRVPLKQNRTIHHDISTKFGAAKVILRTAPPGTGIIAGGAMRAVFESVGIHDIVAKSLTTSNPYNLVKATLKALAQTYTPKKIADKRNRKVSDIVKNRNAVLNIENES